MCLSIFIFFFFFFFFFNDTATTEIYTLSLHDALPIRDCEVDRPPPWPPSALRDRRREAPPLPRHRRIDRKRIERRFDHAEPLGPTCAFVRVGCDERPEVQLGKRGGADRPFQLTGIRGADQDRRIEYEAAHADGSASWAGSRSRSSASVSGAGLSKTLF